MPLCKHWIFSSSGRGRVGSTSIVACTAIRLARYYRVNVLLIHLKSRGDGAERLFPASTCFVQQVGNRIKTPNGWSALLCKLRYHKLEGDSISTYTVKLMNHLDILPGYDSNKMGELRDEQAMVQVQHLTSKHYDFVLWDVSEQELLSFGLADILKIDALIIVLSQTRPEVESVVKERSRDTTAFVIGQYDAYLRLNPANIKRSYSLSQPIFTMPYSSSFRNASDSRSTMDWYMRQSLRHDYGKRCSFITEQEKLTQFILEQSGSPWRNTKAKEM